MRNLISKQLSLAILGLAVYSIAAISSPAAVSGMKSLPHHVPAVVSHLSAKGQPDATNTLNLAIGLPVRNAEALTNLLQRMYDPASVDYHRYLTTEEFTAQFGPTKQDYQAAVDFAHAHGLEVTGTHPNRMVLDVRGKVSDVERAFNVTLKTYRHPTESRDFFAPDVDPSVPANLAIQDVSGLDSYRRPHAKLKFKTASSSQAGTISQATSSAAAPKAGSSPGGNYMGDDFRMAYVPGTTLNGSGQTVALVQFDGYVASDITTYEAMAGRTNIPLQNVLLDGFSGLPTGTGGEVEVSLDIEMVISMAPALAKVIVYEGDPYNFHPNDVLNAIATDNSAKQISCSWGWIGGPMATTDQIFQQMAVQGQTFFVASGDSCAYPAGTVDSPYGYGTPSDSAYLTSVGGTTLTMNGVGRAYTSEKVWNWGTRYGSYYDGVGSSGAISTYYGIPAWQTNISMTACQGSTTMRNMPDVALTADDVFVIADGGIEYEGMGGTSCASPLWAGFTALVNQQATNSSHAPMGFINPALYTIASGSNYTNCFHDITTGNNEWSGSPSLFSAVTNYDLCTGLGTPNGTNLINALMGVASSATHLSPPPAPYGTTLAVLNGSNPNGTWSLFIQDDTPVDGGAITNGWVLALTTANPVGYSAGLAVTATASASMVIVSNNFVYYVTVTNCGPSTSSNVLVVNDLTSGLQLVSSTNTQGTVTRSGSAVIWNVGTLTNTAAQLALTVKAGAAGTFVNSVQASADTPDPYLDDNSASVSVTVGTAVRPQITAGLMNVHGAFQLSITNTTGQSVIIEASTNLVNWIPVFTNVEPFTYTNLDSTNYPLRFYRAKAE
jgi:uncharacterized repeat protein (TIGR01451 family)